MSLSSTEHAMPEVTQFVQSVMETQRRAEVVSVSNLWQLYPTFIGAAVLQAAHTVAGIQLCGIIQRCVIIASSPAFAMMGDYNELKI